MRERSRSATLLAIFMFLSLFLPAIARAQKPAHWETQLRRGRHAVALDTVLLLDSTRSFDSDATGSGRNGARPLRVMIWRPAARSRRPQLEFGAYAELVGFEAREKVEAPSVAAERGRRETTDYLKSLGADSAQAAAALELPMLARRGASPAPGRFPLVLLAVGKDDSPVLHAAAGEYLASHGFIVAGTAGLGARERPMQWAAADLEAQASDLAFLLAWARTRPGADVGRVGIVAFSFGSGAALVVARRDSSIAAIVSLDGSIGFIDRVPIHRALPDLAGPFTIPVMHLNVSGSPRNDLTLLRALVTDLTVVGFAGAGHLDFTTLASMTASVPGMVLSRLGEDTWATPSAVHGSAMLLAQGFLKSHLSD